MPHPTADSSWFVFDAASYQGFHLFAFTRG